MGGGERFRVGSVVTEDMSYHGLVAMVWDSRWEMNEDAYLSDPDTLSWDLVYNLVILGSRQVFDGAGWDILYNPLARWAATPHGNVWYDSV